MDSAIPLVCQPPPRFMSLAPPVTLSTPLLVTAARTSAAAAEAPSLATATANATPLACTPPTRQLLLAPRGRLMTTREGVWSRQRALLAEEVTLPAEAINATIHPRTHPPNVHQIPMNTVEIATRVFSPAAKRALVLLGLNVTSVNATKM
jgi:hypothetical protein